MDSHWCNLCENRMIRDANLTNYCQNHKQISGKSANVRHKRLRKTISNNIQFDSRSHLTPNYFCLTPSNSPSRGRTSLYYPHSRGEDMFVLSPLEAEGKTWWPKGNHPPPWGGVRGGRTRMYYPTQSRHRWRCRQYRMSPSPVVGGGLIWYRWRGQPMPLMRRLRAFVESDYRLQITVFSWANPISYNLQITVFSWAGTNRLSFT